jgi:hypothetical protein
MSDQCAGQWYASACDLPAIIDRRKCRSSLRTVNTLYAVEVHVPCATIFGIFRAISYFDEKRNLEKMESAYFEGM